VFFASLPSVFFFAFDTKHLAKHLALSKTIVGSLINPVVIPLSLGKKKTIIDSLINYM